MLPFPLSENDDEPHFPLPENYGLYLVEESDLPAIAQLTVEVFDATAIRLSSELNRIERAVLAPPVMAWNAFGSLAAFVEVLAGLRQRLANNVLLEMEKGGQIRWKSPRDENSTRLVGHSSLILAIASNSTAEKEESTIVATVELQVQFCDAKVPTSLPGVDRVERGLKRWLSGKDTPEMLQPYLNNLAVAPTHRQRGFGMGLVRVVEWIAFTQWKYDTLYLHVDVENTAAMKLYQKLGYDNLRVQWTPSWSADSSAKIAYFAKQHNAKMSSSRNTV